VEKQRSLFDLKGNTLRVYLYTLKNGRVGVREVQRSLDMSNSSLAQYHLNKLKEAGVVRESGGGYEIVKEVKVDIMRDFLRLGTLIVPRFAIYAILFTLLTVYVGDEAVGASGGTPILGWVTGVLVLASAIFWYESLKAWKSTPP